MPPKANAYSTFIYEKMAKHRIRSFQEAQQKYGASYHVLPEKEKQYYKDIANKQNGTKRKLTSTGEAVEDIAKKQKEQEIKINVMKESITKEIAASKKNGSIKTKTFFVAHMHYHCFRDNLYYPAEVGIAKFSLQNGVEAMYQRIINPGKMPLGSAFEAKKHSEDTHQIEAPVTDSSQNLEEVQSDLIDFLFDGSEDIPIVYTRDEDTGEKTSDIVHNILQNFIELDVKVWSLDYLFYELSTQLAGADGIPLLSVAKDKLNVDSFEYFAEHVCEFHGNCNYAYRCSLSIAVRMCYNVCNQICDRIGIIIIPGKHVPSSFNAKNKVNPASSRGFVPKGGFSDVKPTIRHNEIAEPKVESDDEDGWSCAPMRRPRSQIKKEPNARDRIQEFEATQIQKERLLSRGRGRRFN